MIVHPIHEHRDSAMLQLYNAAAPELLGGLHPKKAALATKGTRDSRRKRLFESSSHLTESHTLQPQHLCVAIGSEAC